MKSRDARPHPSATVRPQRRAIANTPKTTAICWSSANSALGGERRAEHLEEGSQAPQASGAVEVEEVPVGQVAGQDALGEGEHEALFHRRALAAHEPAQRQQERGQQDQDADDVAGVEAPDACRHAPLLTGRRGRDGR